jgi:ribosomal-protein-serine acetyltransferase
MEHNVAVAGNDFVMKIDDVELQPVRVEDAEEFFALVDKNRNRLHSWLAWAELSYSLEDTTRFLELSVAEYATRSSLTMTIRYKGTLCGAIGLHTIDRRHTNSSIGYWIDEAHEGKGIVSTACRAVITEGFQTFGLHRIEIRCATWNHRSSAIPRRLGFVEEGILREAEWIHNRWVDLRVFSMLAQDWTQ